MNLEKQKRFLTQAAFYGVIAALVYVGLKYLLPTVVPFLLAFLILLCYTKKQETVCLYETWGRKRVSEENPGVWTVDEGMTRVLLRVYSDAANLLKLKLSTVGESFYKLHNAAPSIDIYHEDCSHPSYKGSCLAALTHYYTAFGEFPQDTSSLNLSEDEKAYLFTKIQILFL